MKHLLLSLSMFLLGGCATKPAATPSTPASEKTTASVAACRSALALKQSVNSTLVLPLSHAPASGGTEVFLSLKGEQWLCTTDSFGNVNRLELRR